MFAVPFLATTNPDIPVDPLAKVTKSLGVGPLGKVAVILVAPIQ
jgi:hypothetical protein